MSTGKQLMLVKTLSAVLFSLLIATPTFAEVKDKPVASLSIVHMPNRLIYDVGESVDLYGMEVDVTFTDGETYRADYSDLMCLGFDPSIEGSQLVLAQYGSASVPFSITIQRGTIRGIDVEITNKDKWIAGTKLSKSDFKVSAIMSTGGSREVSDFDFTPALLQSGRNVITVEYNGYKKTVSVDAQNNVCISVRIETPGTQEFQVGELFNWVGLKVIATYLDGSEEDVTSACRVGGVSTGVPGDYYAEVTYTDKKLTYPVKVITLTLEDIDVSTYDSDGYVSIKFLEKNEPIRVDKSNVRKIDDNTKNIRTWYVVYGNRTFTKETVIPEADRRYVGSKRVLVRVPIGVNVKDNSTYIVSPILKNKGEVSIKATVMSLLELPGFPLSVTIPSKGETSLELETHIKESISESFYPFKISLEDI